MSSNVNASHLDKADPEFEIETRREILILNLAFIYSHTTNVVELQQALVKEGIITGPSDTGLLDYKIYNIVSLIINHPEQRAYEALLKCLKSTGNEHVIDRLQKTVLPAKKIISAPRQNVETQTQITKADILELTDILSDSVIPYEEFDNFLYEQHIEPEKSYHRKFTQKTKNSEHWRLRKTLKLWVSTYPWLATFEVLINQLEKREYLSVADRVAAMLSDVKREVGTGESCYAGLNRRRGSSNALINDTGFLAAGGVLKDVINRKTENKLEMNTGKPLRRWKIVQFALSLSKIKRHEKLGKLSAPYSDRSFCFKILTITTTVLDVFFDFKFIYDCYQKGEVNWCIISSIHLSASVIFFQILAYRYRTISQNIREHLGLLIENHEAGIPEADDAETFPEDEDEPEELILIKRDSTSLDTVNNAAALSFPNPKSWMFRLFSYCIPLLWPCPSAILHFYWIITYIKLKRHRKPNHPSCLYSSDRVLTIYGELIDLFYDSSHAGKMARYEYFIETLPQLVIRTVYFLNVLMKIGEAETSDGSELNFWSCFSLAVQLLSLGVSLTLFQVASLQYRHFEDQRTFQLEFPWTRKANWMLSSGFSTGSIVLACSMFLKMLFDRLSLFEWLIIFLAAMSYLFTLVIIRRPSFHLKSLKTTLRGMLSIVSDILSEEISFPVDFIGSVGVDRAKYRGEQILVQSFASSVADYVRVWWVITVV